MAEHETGDSSRKAVAVAVGGAVLAAVGAVVFALTGSPDIYSTAVALVLLGGFVVWIGRPLWTAYAVPKPATVGPAVGACVLGLVVLNGSFAATTGPVWGLGTALFFVPAVGLARAVDVT